MQFVTSLDIRKLPFEFESNSKIEAEAPAALAYLKRTKNMDLIEALGLSPYLGEKV